MNQKRLILLFPLCLLALLIGVLGWLTWREVRQERLNRQLIDAIKQEDTTTALSALKQGADANARDEKQTLPAWKDLWNRLRGKRPPPSKAPTALLLALHFKEESVGIEFPKENLPFIQALLTHGAQVNVPDDDGQSPLTYALVQDMSATSRLLIQHGVRVTQGADAEEDMLLEAALYPVDTDVMEMMLQRGANPNGPNDIGWKPLAAAVMAQNPDKVRVLLHYHADPNVLVGVGQDSGSALSFAEQEASSDSKMRQIAQMLQAAGAKE